MTLATSNDIDSLLDGTLDDLADMPEFKPFPAGTHRASIHWEIKKEVKDGVTTNTPILHIKALETVELANPEDAPVANGDITNVMYSFKKKDGTANELGQGQFKDVMKSLATHYGEKSPRELMEESKNAEVMITTKIREDKRDANDVKRYTAVVALQVI